MRVGILAVLSVLTALVGQAGQATEETGFLNRAVTVDGSEYLYQVYVPRNYNDSDEWPVILALHGGGLRGSDGIRQTDRGLAAALRRYPDRYPAIAVFPQSPIEGPGWQELGGRIALAALDQTIQEFSSDEKRVYLTGASQGGNGTWYLAYHHSERFAAAVPICAFVEQHVGGTSGAYYPPISSESSGSAFIDIAAKVASIPIWVFHGDADDVISVEQSRNMASALEAVGANYQYTELPGVGHDAAEPAYAMEAFPTWLFAQSL
jgi:predicted peptidase